MGYSSSIVDAIPLWTLYILSVLIALLSIGVGWRPGDYRQKPAAEDKKAPISAAKGATLGLLAFLLAFTFGMAGSRFDNRQQAVLDEANGIGTTYLRAGGASVIMSPQGIAKAASLQEQLWAIADIARVQSDSVATGLFIQSLNEMIDLDAIRLTANRNRIPESFWLMLGVVTILSMAALGYEFGQTGTRNWVITIMLVVVFTTVIVLIADLDRPQAGFLRVSQQPLLDVIHTIGTPVP